MRKIKRKQINGMHLKMIDKKLKKQIIKQSKEVLEDTLARMGKLKEALAREGINKITAEVIIKGLR